MLYVDWLFLDMNAYFASAEQQMQPVLRGRPVAVVPSMTDRTCCIAVSYEARAYGIKTGTNVGEARRRCPQLQLVAGRHENYVRIHQQIIAAVETVLPVEKVCSIDEMACKLSPQHRESGAAVSLAGQVKQAIAHRVGPYLRCSIGLATNRFLAKVASNMQKPDGLVLIAREQLPHRLYSLALTDLPGIGRNMLRRLESKGVRSTCQLCSLSKAQMVDAWQSVLGEQWWHWLRGEDCHERPTHRRTVGHSHVLPPKLRSDDGARGVLVRLLHKAAMRLRRLDYWAARMVVSLSYTGGWPKWKETVYLGRCQDTPSMLKALERAWSKRPPGARPIKVSITLFDLTPSRCTTPSLFVEERRALQAARAMDAVNERFGANSVYFASMHETRDTAPLRIAFTNIPDVTTEGARED
ncbi:MAG: type VI secretion protein ImpB [Planctomycetales bacterium]|nr:type VI secretion protein ImpB [Planctomycetales bacterium]